MVVLDLVVDFMSLEIDELLRILAEVLVDHLGGVKHPLTISTSSSACFTTSAQAASLSTPAADGLLRRIGATPALI